MNKVCQSPVGKVSMLTLAVQLKTLKTGPLLDISKIFLQQSDIWSEIFTANATGFTPSFVSFSLFFTALARE